MALQQCQRSCSFATRQKLTRFAVQMQAAWRKRYVNGTEAVMKMKMKQSWRVKWVLYNCLITCFCCPIWAPGTALCGYHSVIKESSVVQFHYNFIIVNYSPWFLQDWWCMNHVNRFFTTRCICIALWTMPWQDVSRPIAVDDRRN